MRAATYSQYGPPEVIKISEVAKPIVKDNEISIKIIATSLNAGDRRIRSLDMPRGFRTISRLALGITAPRNKILGVCLAGIVDEVGDKVTKYKVGDDIIASLGISMGAHAQFICLSEKADIILKPKEMSFEIAAALSFGGATAWHFLTSNCKVEKDSKILINGASGSTGSATLQIAKHFGANITAICSTKNIEMVKSLGADQVIDYTKQDFTKNDLKYDIIMDTVGNAAWERSANSLTEKGHLLLVAGDMSGMINALFRSSKKGKKIKVGAAPSGAKVMKILADLHKNGEYQPFIDKIFKLEDMVEAHRYVDSPAKRGNVVITIGHD